MGVPPPLKLFIGLPLVTKKSTKRLTGRVTFDTMVTKSHLKGLPRRLTFRVTNNKIKGGYMPKQIKLTDRVAEKLAQRAEEDNLSLAGEVSKLLEGGGGENNSAITSIIGKLDYLEGYLDKRLSKLESLIEDTTIDRVDNAGPRKSYSNVKVYVPWDTAHELLYEFLPEDAPEFIGNASEQIRQADYEFPVFIVENRLWTEDAYGTKSPILNITPRVAQHLIALGVDSSSLSC